MSKGQVASKKKREVQDMCEEVGLDLVTIELTKGNHIRYHVRHRITAEVRSYYDCNTPSDYRGRLNARARLKAFQREGTPK